MNFKSTLKLLVPIAGVFFSIGSLVNYLQDGSRYSLYWTIGSFAILLISLIFIYLDTNTNGNQ